MRAFSCACASTHLVAVLLMPLLCRARHRVRSAAAAQCLFAAACCSFGCSHMASAVRGGGSPAPILAHRMRLWSCVLVAATACLRACLSFFLFHFLSARVHGVVIDIANYGSLCRFAASYSPPNIFCYCAARCVMVSLQRAPSLEGLSPSRCSAPCFLRTPSCAALRAAGFRAMMAAAAAPSFTRTWF